MSSPAHRSCFEAVWGRFRPALACFQLLLQRLDRDFLEIDDVVTCLVLQADVAFVRTAARVGFVREFPGMGGLAFGVVGYLDAVQHDDGARAVERDVHSVPLRTRLARKSQWLGE